MCIMYILSTLQLHHIDAKLHAAKTYLSQELDSTCQCQFSDSYLLFHQSKCLLAHTDWVVLWGRIVGTNHSTSTDIRSHLQKWSDDESKLVVEGVHLTSLQFCTVILNEGDLPFCEAPTSRTIQETPIVGPTSPSPIIPVIIVVVTLMLVVVSAVLVCIVTVKIYKRRVKAKISKRLRYIMLHIIYMYSFIV